MAKHSPGSSFGQRQRRSGRRRTPLIVESRTRQVTEARPRRSSGPGRKPWGTCSIERSSIPAPARCNCYRRCTCHGSDRHSSHLPRSRRLHTCAPWRSTCRYCCSRILHRIHCSSCCRKPNRTDSRSAYSDCKYRCCVDSTPRCTRYVQTCNKRRLCKPVPRRSRRCYCCTSPVLQGSRSRCPCTFRPGRSNFLEGML